MFTDVKVVSCSYAFMEFDSAMDGKKVRDHFNTKQSFEVDGKLAMVEYAKNTYSTMWVSPIVSPRVQV